jgi:hypothetical protein
MTEAEAKSGNPVKIFGGSLVIAVLMSINLAMFIGPKASVAFATFAGFAAGAFWVAGGFGMTYLFERRPMSLFLINGGYHVVAFTVMGAVIGLLK